MQTLRSTRLIALLAISLSAACESTSAPDFGLELDAEAAAADYAAFDSVFVSPAWSGFEALGTRTPWSGGPAAAQAVAGIREARSGRQFALQLAQRLAAAAGARPSRAPVIDTYRGDTFVYDPDTGEYAVDPARTGAPANGVRFVIYEVRITGEPIVEEEIGYADLIDEGDDSEEDVALRLLVVSDDVTVLDYRTTVDLTLTSGAITVDGFLRGERGEQLDFAIEVVGTHQLEHSTLEISFDLGIDARDFSIVGSVHGVEEGAEGEGDVELVVQHRDDEVRLVMNGSEGQLDGSIHLNGQLFATVTGDAENPTILSADGDPLTPREMHVLHHIVDVVEDVFDFLEDLVDPVDEIVFLGIIL
jgi:hypothetical protein